MDSFFIQMEKIISHDPGKRGVDDLFISGELEQSAVSLSRGGSVWIVTGFLLGPGLVETDGPLGALALALALNELNYHITIIADTGCRFLLQTLFERYAPPTIIFKNWEELERPFSALFTSSHPSHLIAIERPGRNRWGDYLNARCQSVANWNAPADELFLCEPRPITIGIGDGGNEIGMGKITAESNWPGRSIVSTDYLITAGVSNWGAYALCGALSLLNGKSLVPLPELESEWLNTLVTAGAVDGFSLKPELKIDGLSIGFHAEILSKIQNLVTNFLGKSIN